MNHHLWFARVKLTESFTTTCLFQVRFQVPVSIHRPWIREKKMRIPQNCVPRGPHVDVLSLSYGCSLQCSTRKPPNLSCKFIQGKRSRKRTGDQPCPNGVSSRHLYRDPGWIRTTHVTIRSLRGDSVSPWTWQNLGDVCKWPDGKDNPPPSSSQPGDRTRAHCRDVYWMSRERQIMNSFRILWRSFFFEQ